MSDVSPLVQITDANQVRTIQLQRPQAKNAMNEAMWDAVAEALIDAAENSQVSVVVFTGSGDSFSAGQDVIEMAMGASGTLERGKHSFSGLADQLVEFPKPLICAVNGIGLGFGVTILGFADLVFMSTTARLKCPFTTLGVAPELGSSFLFPQLLGRQNASWMLMSSEWFSAEQCKDMGLVFAICEPDHLLQTAIEHAEVLASKPLNSLMESKRVIAEPFRAEIRAARSREDNAFKVLMGSPENIEAMTAFAEKRPPDFSKLGK